MFDVNHFFLSIIIKDLRFLSIDFLNTFLLTYRVFTDGETVLNALKKVFYNAQPNEHIAADQINERLNIPGKDGDNLTPRRTSGASSVSGNELFHETKTFRSTSRRSCGLNEAITNNSIVYLRLLFRRC